MAQVQDFRTQVQAIQREPQNKSCVDCGSVNPQWASVSFGTFFCLECSGQHRSLGVHISFVRSVTMDSWKEDQFRKMKLGGNEKCREFFREYAIEALPIREKYYTKAADLYREKLAAELSGNSISIPPPSPDLAVPNVPGAAQSVPRVPMPDKAQTEKYFHDKQMQNQSRPADLPPNQGGKYGGFGSSPYTPESSSQNQEPANDAFASISKGFMFFSSKATEIARLAAEQATVISKDINDNVIRPATQKMQDPALRQNISETLNSWGTQIASTTDKGFDYLTNAIAGEGNPAPPEDKLQPPTVTTAADNLRQNVEEVSEEVNAESQSTSVRPPAESPKPGEGWNIDTDGW